MSWAETLKINSDISTPLNELIYALSPEGAFYFISNASFVVPCSCTLTIRACGGGGNGTRFQYTDAVGGGGGGGYCKDRRRYKKGDIINVTIANKNVVVTCESAGLNMTATCGGSAMANTSSSSTCYGGVGGEASGGNLLNLPGGKGGFYGTGTDYNSGNNHNPEGGDSIGCGGGAIRGMNGPDALFAGGHGSAYTYFDSNLGNGARGGNGNFCGGSGGKGSNGYTTANAGYGGKGGDSTWGFGGHGGNSYNGSRGGDGGNGYFYGGNAGSSSQTSGSASVGYPGAVGSGGTGPALSTFPYPAFRASKSGFGCGGSGGNDDDSSSCTPGGQAICIIEIGYGRGEY